MKKRTTVWTLFCVGVLSVCCLIFASKKTPDELISLLEADGNAVVFQHAYSEYGKFVVLYNEQAGLVSAVDINLRKNDAFWQSYKIRRQISYDVLDNKLISRDIKDSVYFNEYTGLDKLLYGTELFVPCIEDGVTEFKFLKFGICRETVYFEGTIYEATINNCYIFCAIQQGQGF